MADDKNEQNGSDLVDEVVKPRVETISIHCAGEPGVGIPDYYVEIKDVGFETEDLTKEEIEEIRHHLKEAFYMMTGGDCTVEFDYETEAYNKWCESFGERQGA